MEKMTAPINQIVFTLSGTANRQCLRIEGGQLVQTAMLFGPQDLLMALLHNDRLESVFAG